MGFSSSLTLVFLESLNKTGYLKEGHCSSAGFRRNCLARLGPSPLGFHVRRINRQQAEANKCPSHQIKVTS